jgi:tape measure domain-containing protein
MARMGLDTAIRISAEVKGGGNIDRVKKSLQDLAKGSQTTARDMDTLRSATFQFARANDNTIGGIRNSITAFRGLQEQAKIGSREFQRYGSEVQKLETKLRGLDGTASQANGRIAGVAAAAGRLIAAYAGIEAVRFVFGNAAELESQTRSMEVLTGSAERATQIVQELQQLGAVTPFTSTELIDTAKRLQAFGVEAEQVVDITRRLADVSGATGAELAGLATAYGQVQAKGRLQGEELLQFQERGVALQEVLRKEYGLTGAEFQKALEKGQISAEAVEYALKKLTDSGGKYANGAIAQSDTLRGKMSTLTDSVQVLAQTIGNTLEPVFKWALSQATAVVGEIQRLIDEANNAGGAKDREAQFANNANAAVRAMGLNPFTQQGMMADMRQRNIEQQRADYELSRRTARAANNAPTVTTRPPLSGNAMGTPIGAVVGGGAAGVAGSSGSRSGTDFKLSSRGQALVAAAKKLGVSPLDLATIISFETGGTFSPSKMGGAGGNYMGLIQFGPSERKTYGAREGQSFEEQVTGPVVRYFQDRFGKVGMSTQGASLLDLYTTVLAGNPKANRNARDSFGTSPVSGVQRMGPHRQKALQTFFGGSAQNTEYGPMEQAEIANNSFEQMRDQLKQADELNAKFRDQLAIIQETDSLKRLTLESEIKQNEITSKYNELRSNALSADETTLINSSEMLEKRISQLEQEQQINDLLEKRVQLMIDVTRAASMPTVYNELEAQDAALKSVLDKYPAIGAAADAAATMATSGMSEMIAGAQSAEEVFVNFLESVADALMDTAKQMIAQYIAIGVARMIAGLGGGGAPGGFAPSGPLAAVGNINPMPTSFVPSFAGGGFTGSGARSGGLDGQGGFMAMLHPRESVIDHTRPGATGSSTNVVVNVDASGNSKVSGDGGQAEQLGRVVSQAVQAELIRQKRPGGILA